MEIGSNQQRDGVGCGVGRWGKGLQWVEMVRSLAWDPA